MLMLFKKGIMASLVIAVVLNFVGCGSSIDTTTSSDSETTSEVTSLGGGVASKGPFKEGSVVVAYKLNIDGNRSETSAKTLTTDNKGNYSFEEGLPWSGPTEFVIYGEYLNENTGNYMVLTEETGLSSVIDLEENKTVKANINIFTDMEADSIKSKMSRGISLTDAKLESQNSIKKIFNISSDVKFEELDLTDGTDNVEANTKLLIISSALLKTVNPEDTLKKLVEDLSDGDLNGVGMAVFDDLKEKVSNVDIQEVATNIEDILGVSNVPDSELVLNGTLSLDNNISFKDTYDADLNSSYISNEVTIDGIYGGSGNISVENGEYSIDGSEFVSSAGSVSNGQRVRVKLLSANEYSTKIEAKVTIAGVAFSYNVVTKTDPDKIDTTPNLFDFGYVKDAEANTQVESQIVTVSGINQQISILIDNGEYKINDGNWTSQNGMVNNEDNISVRVSVDGIGTQTISTVTIGGVSGNFSVFTVASDKTPDSNVSFDNKMDVERNLEIVSNSIIINGINTEVDVSIDNGSFDINESNNFVTEAKLSNATAVRIKLTSASDWEKETIANLKVNNTIFTFKVKTMSDPTVTDATPDEFKFTTLVNQSLSTEVQSKAVVISGINTNVSVSVENGEYSVNGSDFTSEKGTISAGDSIVVKQTTASEFNTEKITTLSVGGVSGTFKTLTVEEDKVPVPFIFENQDGVPLDTVIVSNTVTIAGINTDVNISIENGEYSVNGNSFISSVGTVKNGDTVTLRHTSASTPETVTTTSLTVGTSPFLFSSKTIAGLSIDDTNVVNTATRGVFYEFIPLLKDNSSPVNSWRIENKPSWTEFNSTTGRLYGTPTNNDVGIDRNVTIIATNEAGSDSLSFDLTVLNVNNAPVANDANITLNEDESSNINLLLLVQDVGDELNIITVTNPTNGIIVNNGDGTVVYTPNTNFNGSDSFTYTVSDSSGVTATATVTITVNGVNDAPVAESLSFSVNEDNILNGSLSANDIDGDSLTYSLVNSSASGSVSINSDTGDFRFTPNSNFNGYTTFRYKVNDGSVDSNEATVTIRVNPVNDAPVAESLSFSVNENNVLNGSLSANDVDGDSLTYSLVSASADGSVTIDANTGEFTFTPNTNFNGATTFSYKVNDGSVDSNEATVTITVNNAPMVTWGDDFSGGGIFIAEDTNASIHVDVIDADGDTLSFDVNSSNTSILTATVGTIDEDGFFLNLNTVANAYGSVTICVTAYDGHISTSDCYPFEVVAVNDAPTISAISNQSISEDSGSHSVDINVSDIDNNVSTLTVTAVSSNESIVRVEANTSAVTFTTVNDAYGDVNITVTVNDGDLNASTTFGVHVENMPESVSGRVMVDDYVANAKLYVYDNFIRTNLIASGTTDENGSFDIVLPYMEADEVPSLLYIHSVGGTIIGSAMVAPNMDIIASSSYPNNITPLTTLVNDWYFNFYDTYSQSNPSLFYAIKEVESQTDLYDPALADAYSNTILDINLNAYVAMQKYILNGNFMTSTLSDGNYTMSMLSFGAGDVGDVNISSIEDLESKISTYTFSVTNGVIQGNSDESISGVVSGTTVAIDINKMDGSFVSIAGSVGLFGSSSGVSSLVESDGTTQKGFFVAQFIPEDISDEQKNVMKENLLITVDCRKDFVYRIPIGEMSKMGIGSLSDLANEDSTTITLFEDDINITEGDGRLDFADFDTNESRFMLKGNDITSFATRVFNLHDGGSSSDSLQAKVYLIQPIGVRKALVVATDPSSGEIVGIGNSYISTQGALALPDAGIGANSSYKFSIAKVHSGMIGGTRDDMLAEQMIDDPMEINTTMESNTSDYRPVLSALRVQPDSEQNSTNITLLSGSVWGLYNDTNQNDLNDSNDSMHIVQIYQSGAFDGEAIVGGVSDEGEKLKNYPGVFVGSIYYNSASSTTNKIFVKIPFISTQNFVMRPLYTDDTSKLGKILYGKITLNYSDANLSIEGQESDLSNSFDYNSGMYHLEGTLDDGTYIDVMWPSWGKKAVYTISSDSAGMVTEVGEAYFSF